MIEIDGRFWLKKDGKSFLGSGRIELLEKIAAKGSMNAAAKEMKMSYKAAWDRINAMNDLADKPIIERTTGGKGGGGTVLTAHAYELIATYKRFEELHSEFIHRFSEASDDPEHLARILARTFLTTSARNQIKCKVKSIEVNNLKATLALSLKNDLIIYSTITQKSIKNMGINEGFDVYAIIKSSDIKLSSSQPKDEKNMNILPSIIKKIELSQENIEITLHLQNSTELVLIMQKENNDFAVGQNVYALIPYNNIILGV